MSLSNATAPHSGGAGSDRYLPGSNEQPIFLWFQSAKLEVAFAAFVMVDRTLCFLMSLVVSICLIIFVAFAQQSGAITSRLTSAVLTCGGVVFCVFTVILFYFWHQEETDRLALQAMTEQLAVTEDQHDDPLTEDGDRHESTQVFLAYGKKINALELTMCGLIVGLYILFAGFTVGKGPTECSDRDDPTSCSRYIFLDGGIVAMFVIPLFIFPIRFFACVVVTTVCTTLYIAVRELPEIRTQTSVQFRLLSIMWYVIIGTVAMVSKRLTERDTRAHFREQCVLGKQKERSRRLEAYYASITAAMIPASVAKRIARGELYRERLDQAIVCVVGVRGFTRISTEWSCGEVVLMLQHITVHLDGLLRSFGGGGGQASQSGRTALKVHAFGDEYVVVLHQNLAAMQQQKNSTDPQQQRRKSQVMSTSQSHRMNSSLEQRQGISGQSGDSEIEQSRSRHSATESLNTVNGNSDTIVIDALHILCYGVARISRDLEPACRCLSATPVCIDVAAECGSLYLTTFGTQKNFLAVGPVVDRCRETRRQLECTPFLRPFMCGSNSTNNSFQRMPHTVIAASDALWGCFVQKWSRHRGTETGVSSPLFLDLDEASTDWTMTRTTALLVASRTVLPLPQFSESVNTTALPVGGLATAVDAPIEPSNFFSPAGHSARLSWGGGASRHDNSVANFSVFLETPLAQPSSDNTSINMRGNLVTMHHKGQRPSNTSSNEQVRNPFVGPLAVVNIAQATPAGQLLALPVSTPMQDSPMDPLSVLPTDEEGDFSTTPRPPGSRNTPRASSLVDAINGSPADAERSELDVHQELRRPWVFLPLYEFTREELEAQYRNRASNQNITHRLMLILVATSVVFGGAIVCQEFPTGLQANTSNIALYIAISGLAVSLVGLVLCVLLSVVTDTLQAIPPVVVLGVELTLAAIFMTTVIMASETPSLLAKGHLMWFGIVVMLSLLRDHHNIIVPQFWLFDIIIGGTFLWLAKANHASGIQYGMVSMVSLYLVFVIICRGLFDRGQRHRFLTAESSRLMQNQLIKDGQALEDLLRHMVPNETFAQLFRRTRIAATPLIAMVLNLRGVLPRGTLFATKAEVMSVLQLMFTPKNAERCGSRAWWSACDIGLSITDRALGVVKESCIIKTSGDVALVVDDSSHDATTQAMVLLQLVTYIVHYCRAEHPEVVVRGTLTNGPVAGAVLGIAALSFEFHGEAVTVGASLLRELPPSHCQVIATTRFVELLQWNSLFGESSSARLPIRAAATMDDIHKGFDLTAQFEDLSTPTTTTIAASDEQPQQNGDGDAGSPTFQSSTLQHIREPKLVRIVVRPVQLWRVRGIQTKVPCHVISLEDGSPTS